MKNFWNKYAFEIIAIAIIVGIVFANSVLYGRNL